jgi:hypothetical protein
MSRLFLGVAASVVCMLTACSQLAPVSARARQSLEFATFSGIDQSEQGGLIARVVYSEHPGDADFSSISVANGQLRVKGRFTGKANSRWAGVGVLVDAPAAVIDASRYRALRIRLSAVSGVDKLRVRLTGIDQKAIQSGCYPVAVLPVTPQAIDYEVDFSQFAPERFCGAQGVPTAVAITRLAAIEVVDAQSPVRERPVEFSVESISLLR